MCQQRCQVINFRLLHIVCVCLVNQKEEPTFLHARKFITSSKLAII